MHERLLKLASGGFLPDDPTNSLLRQCANNPGGFAFWRKQCLEYSTGDSLKRQFVNCIRYIFSPLLVGERYYLKEIPKRELTAAAVHFGMDMTANIKVKTRKKYYDSQENSLLLVWAGREAKACLKMYSQLEKVLP